MTLLTEVSTRRTRHRDETIDRRAQYRLSRIGVKAMA